MKTKKLKMLAIAAFSAGMMTSCSQDDDFKTTAFTPLLASQDFEQGDDNTILTMTGWENVATNGTAVWKEQEYGGNGYAEFTSYQSGELSNVAWLISPAIDMDANEGEVLRFLVSQSYVTAVANKLEVLVSSDYDGANLGTATWTALNANLPATTATYFLFQDSGEIDLSAYTGNIHIAFKATGSGTNTALDGSYQIDQFRVYY